MNTLSICLYVKDKEKEIIEWLEIFKEFKNDNVELIIVDDGSVDQTLIHIQTFALTYQGKLKLLMTPAIGEIKARRKAIAFMHGDFFSFLSIDALIVDRFYLDELPLLLNKNSMVYALYPALDKERVLPKHLMLAYLPCLSNYIFNRDVITKIQEQQLILYPDFYQLIHWLTSVDEVICLPFKSLKAKYYSIIISKDSIDFFCYFYEIKIESNALIMFLMIYHILIKGIQKKVDKKELYQLQKIIKSVDSQYLNNRYLRSLDLVVIKQLKYLKHHLLFLI
jgi:Glycosyltransferases involved in cell wall biogenesis